MELARNQEFNLIDAFRVFDPQGNGFITTDQIVSGLRQNLDTSVTPGEVHSFMNIFDKDQDGRLKYSEFCDAFLPLDNMQASNLAQKPP